MEKKLVYMLEDDSDDRYITESTIEEFGFPIQIKFFSNSNQFLQFLSTADKSILIILDYNSRPENAVSLLERIKKDNTHKGTPVVILSDNSIPKYREECYAFGASSFVQKPSKMN